jgi:hypothetical protein
VRRAALGAAIVAALFAAGCGESTQVTVYKQGKYQGKPDTRPWDNAPAGPELRGGNWAKGDKGAWESALNARNLAQNEYKRIEHQ